MSDIFDQATEREEIDRERAIQSARSVTQQFKPTGFCQNCNEPVPGEHVFCDSDCRNMWQDREDAAKRNGR